RGLLHVAAWLMIATTFVLFLFATTAVAFSETGLLARVFGPAGVASFVVLWLGTIIDAAMVRPWQYRLPRFLVIATLALVPFFSGLVYYFAIVFKDAAARMHGRSPDLPPIRPV